MARPAGLEPAWNFWASLTKTKVMAGPGRLELPCVQLLFHLFRRQRRYDPLKTCPKCAKNLPDNAFYTRSDRSGETQPYCKKCWNEYAAQRQRRQKELAVQKMGGKCSKCGYDKCLAALDFHHLDPTIKDIGISATRLGKKKLEEELKKCILVCANCHREIHALSN